MTDKKFIELRLRKTLGGYVRPVVEDPSLEVGTPDVVRNLLASDAGLVDDSAVLATTLHQQQKAVSPGGLVMTVIGTLDTARCVVIAKMEHQQGMRVQQIQNDAGLRTYRAEHLKDLILGEGTRVFKAGVFKALDSLTIAPLRGHVVDDQQGHGGVAEYFVEFLGCQFELRADVLTEKFFSLTQKFVREATAGDPEKNARYEISLLSELNSAAKKIVPDTYAMNHLQGDHRDTFLTRIEAAGLPIRGFAKDTSLIKSKIRRMRITTERGADVLAPPEMFADGAVEVSSDLDGQEASIVIRDVVSRISGASGRQTTQT